MTTTVSICYSTTNAYYPDGYNYANTLEDVLYAWADEGIPGSHPANPGGFYNNGTPSAGFSGDTYALSANGYAISVCGDLNYYFYPISDYDPEAINNHTLYGSISSISLGGGLNTDGTVLNPFLTICFDEPLSGTLAEGWGGIVHQVVYGLMGANVDPLLDLLDSLGVDIDGTSIAGLPESTADCDCGCDSELVGVPEFDDYLLAA